MYGLREPTIEEAKNGQRYNLIKIYSNGDEYLQGRNYLLQNLKIGERCNTVGRSLRDSWSTSPVKSIEEVPRGILFTTLNSTYLLEFVATENK